MAEENTNATETEVSSNQSGPVITTERTSTEVLDGSGNTLNGDSPLSKIFDKIESGEEAKTAVKAVMGNKAAAGRALFDDTPPAEENSEDKPEEKPAEVIIESKKDDKAPAQTKTATEDEVSDDELKVLPHDKPKTAKRIDKLLKKIGDAEAVVVTTRKEAEEKAAKVAQLEADLAKLQNSDPFADERVKRSLDELSMYRRRYDLEKDPDVKSKYDGRIEGAENAIYKTLTDRGLPQDVTKIIKEEGGWLKFIDSSREVPLQNGKTMSAAELAEAIKTQLPVSARREIEALELEQIQTRRDKEVYFQEETKKAREYFDNQENMTKKQKEEAQKRFQDASKVVSEWKSKFVADNAWLKEKTIDAKLSPEQRAELEDHNKHAKQLNQLMDKYLGAKDIDGMLEVLVDSIRYHQERRELAFALDKNKKLEDQLKAKQAEIDRFKKSDSSINKGGSLRVAPAAKSAAEEKEAGPKTLEDAFFAIEQGKSVES